MTHRPELPSQPLHRWTGMLDAGVRAAFVASVLAAKKMIARRRGLIVNIGYWAARKRLGNAIYGISKAATDKMTSDTAQELRPPSGSIYRTAKARSLSDE
jgi:NAD(P)-dependent dehydrogenase (short-subunit alcohol dehydrogenase family)